MSIFRKTPEVNAQVVAIVGMHRSGTSCLAGSLQQKGLYLGKVHERNDHNLKGNRENPSIATLNESILEHSGGSWHEPPKRLSWTHRHEKQRNAIVSELEAANAPAWGFKDPRALLTMPFWLKVLPASQFVGTYRHPYLVTQSLQRRDSMPIDYATRLWESYNQKLLELHERQPFHVISFDLDSQDYLTEVDAIAAELKLPDAGNQEAFMDKSLKNALSDMPPNAVSSSAIALHAKLDELNKTL
jgi:hypothetical protein